MFRVPRASGGLKRQGEGLVDVAHGHRQQVVGAMRSRDTRSLGRARPGGQRFVLVASSPRPSRPRRPCAASHSSCRRSRTPPRPSLTSTGLPVAGSKPSSRSGAPLPPARAAFGPYKRRAGLYCSRKSQGVQRITTQTTISTDTMMATVTATASPIRRFGSSSSTYSLRCRTELTGTRAVPKVPGWAIRGRAPGSAVGRTAG